MYRIFLILLLGEIVMVNCTAAQTLFLSYPRSLNDSVGTVSPGIRLSPPRSEEFVLTSESVEGYTKLDILPSYAKENPSGYSWLCRMELKIENELPIGVWVKAGDSGGIVNSTGNNLHLKLKLFRF